MTPAAFCNEIAWLMSILRRYPSQMLGRPSYGGGSQAQNFTPREPLTEDVASWLPIALFILEQSTESAVCDEFETVMRSAFSAEGIANYDFPRWRSHLTYSSRTLRRSPQLEVKKVDRIDGLRKLGICLKAAHIPEIIWPEVADSFRKSLALDRDSDFDLRTTLALIAKQELSDREEGTNLSRFTPARHPRRSVSKKERLVCSGLRASFTDDQLFSALSSGLEEWFASNHMVDYVERHRRFIGWEGIDDKSWAHIEGILLERIPQASNRAWHHCSHEVRLRATGSRGTQGPRLVPISRLSHEHSWSKMEKHFGRYVEAYTRTCLSDPHRNEDDLFRRFIDELSASEPDATAVVHLRRAAQDSSSQKAA